MTSSTWATSARTEIGVTFGSCVGEPVEQRGLGGGRHVDRGGERVRRRLEHARAEQEDEVEARLAPVDLGAQVGDLGLDHPAQHVEAEAVADPDAVGGRDLVLDRDQRRAGIVLGPPGAGDQLGARRPRADVAQAAVVAERPVVDPGLVDRHAVDPHDPAPDDRRDLHQLGAVGRP